MSDDAMGNDREMDLDRGRPIKREEKEETRFELRERSFCVRNATRQAMALFDLKKYTEADFSGSYLSS